MPLPSSLEMLCAASDYIGRKFLRDNSVHFFGGPSLAIYLHYQGFINALIFPQIGASQLFSELFIGSNLLPQV
jgi:hypothetical protein